jgi:glycosyltransferase involved in cell wall biosynthesis
LLLVGAGSQRARLEALATRLGVGNRVHFAGWRPDVPEILAATALLVLPSAWEGMPNAVLQAMASGLPVLATDVEGVAELLGPDADLQTVPYGDSAAWQQKIIRLLWAPAEAWRLGQRNRARAETEFDWAKVVAAYQDLWAGLC